jgi:hypothetical protein
MPLDLPVKVRASRHIVRNGLERHVRQGEARRPEHEAAEETEVDAARHLQQRIEVGHRTESAEEAGQARAPAPAEQGEGVQDRAVADQIEYGMDLVRLGDALGKVRPFHLGPARAEGRQRLKPVPVTGGRDDLYTGVRGQVEGSLTERRRRPPDDERLARSDLEVAVPDSSAVDRSL